MFKHQYSICSLNPLCYVTDTVVVGGIEIFPVNPINSYNNKRDTHLNDFDPELFPKENKLVFGRGGTVYRLQ